jgi:hypothetical protein
LESVGDARLRWSVSEWRPAFATIHLGAMMLWAIYITLFLRVYKTLSLSEKTVFIATFIMGATSMRNMPVWAVVAAPITTHSVEGVISQLSSYGICVFICKTTYNY